VRFLDNPYFVPELRSLTGLDAAVANYVLAAPETQEFLRRTRELLEYVMPKYEREGKSYLTIAIGCTGGRHRSVAIAEALAQDLATVAGAAIAVVHRDAQRGNVGPRETRAPEQPAAETGTSEDRPSALELKGAATPPPSTTTSSAAAQGSRLGRQ
jgi:hypothetical protein